MVRVTGVSGASVERGFAGGFAGGFVFSVMALLLVLLLVSLSSFMHSSRITAFEQDAGFFALERAEGKFSSYYSLFSLGKDGAQRRGFERLMPFDYSLDSNLSVLVSFPSDSNLSSYFDYAYALGVFVSDGNFSNEFDGIPSSLSVPKSVFWGGSDESASFSLSPQCLEYSVSGDSARLAERDGCSFSPGEIALYSFTVIAKQGAEFDSVHYDVREAASGPVVEFFVDDSKCPGCAIPEAQKSFTGFFDPGTENRISVQCTGCETRDVNITFSSGFSVLHQGSDADVNTSMSFSRPVGGAVLNGFFLSVLSPDGNFSVRYP